MKPTFINEDLVENQREDSTEEPLNYSRDEEVNTVESEIIPALSSDDLDIFTSAMFDMLADEDTGKRSLPGRPIDTALDTRSLVRFLEWMAKDEDREMVQMPVLNERKGIRVKDRSVRRLHLSSLPTYISIASQLPRMYRYNEEIEVFLSCCDAHPVPEVNDIFRDFCRNPETFYVTTPNEYETMRTFVNGFVQDLQKRLRGPKFKRKIRDRRRLAETNFEESANYVRSLLKTHHRLVVLRIDLHYKNESKATFEELEKDLKSFYENQRHNKKLFRHLLGYIEKIECGLERGFHVHVLLLFDADKRKKHADSYFAEKIGNYWVNVITKGRGTFFNCNRKEHKQKFKNKNLLGIGFVQEKDENTIKNLLRIIHYFCKAEQFLKLRAHPKAKLLRKKQWQKQDKPKRDRPRDFDPNAKDRS